MKKSVKESVEAAFSIRMRVSLVMLCAFCIAMVPAVAATGTFIDNASVTVNESYFATIEGTDYDWNYFFGILNAAGYSYTWSNDSRYSDRKYLETLTIGNTTYPSVANTTDDYEWKIVDSLDESAYLYKKGLAAWADTDGHYYLWYGNDTAARGYYNGRSDWLFPTVENATYIVDLDVTIE